MPESTLAEVVDGKPATLEVSQEGCHQHGKPVNPALFPEYCEYLLRRDRRPSDATGRELFLQVTEQYAVAVFTAECLYQDGAISSVFLTLPLHVPKILLAVDVRRGLPLGIQTEVLDVDAVIGEMEVGLVLTLLRRRRVVFIVGFVLIANPVEVEEVRNNDFLEALDSLTVERSDGEAAEVFVILAPALEFVLALVGCE